MDPAALSTDAIASMISARTPSPDEFAAFFMTAYGVQVSPVGPGTNSEEVYRSTAGDLITTSNQGACGTSYWQVMRQSPGQESVVLICLGRLSDSGEVRLVSVNAWGS